MDLRIFKPMLAKPMNWTNKNMMKTVRSILYLQPKLDGIRCCIYIENGEVVLQSRQLKEFKGHAMDDLRAEVGAMYTAGLIDEQTVLDGELYIHGLSFNEVQSLVSNFKTPYNPDNQCNFNIYDVFVGTNPAMQFKDRRHYIKTMLGIVRTIDESKIKVVMYDVIDNTNKSDSEIRDILFRYHDKYKGMGYEGLIIRTADGPYAPDKRPNDLIKLKTFSDEEYEIVAIEEGIGKNVGIPTITLKLKESDVVNPKNTTFNAVLDGAEEYRRDIWENRDKYIGEMCTVKFFEKSSDNIPRFPVIVGIRNYE